MASPSSETILITGANGYVASNVVKAVLDKGYNARGTARSESSIAKLRETFSEYPSQISFAIVKDMTNVDNYKDAFDGVTGVFHTASPFNLSAKDIRRELLDPAINGAVTILEATKKYGPSVKRVIHLSSFASNLDVPKGYRPGYTYNDDDWNPMTYDEAAASDVGAAQYCASKGLAERAMWEWMKKNDVPFTLTSINPAWVFGPIVGKVDLTHLGESMEAMWSLVGASKLHDFDFGGFVDARDLSQAMILAYESPDAPGQRFITASHFDWQTVVDIANKEVPELQGRLPKERSEYDLVEGVYKIDASKAERVLGLKYTPLSVTVRDTYKQLLAAEASA